MKLKNRRLKPWQRLVWQTAALVVGGWLVDGIWYAVAGHRPTWWERSSIVLGGWVMWEYVQHWRLRVAFEDLVDRYELHPAYGEDPEEFWGDRD